MPMPYARYPDDVETVRMQFELPVDLRDAFVAHCKSQTQTLSGKLRALILAELNQQENADV